MIVSTLGRRISHWLSTQLAKIRVEVRLCLHSFQEARHDVQGDVYDRGFEVRVETT